MMNVYLKILLWKKFDIHALVDKCAHFNVNLLKYSDDKTFGFENDIDPNNFYNNKIASKCEYYTDTQFKNNISKVKGLSFIHFNAKSLKANLQK